MRLSAPALEAGREGTVLLGWRDGDRTWPLLVELPEAILLTASPLDGRPALRTTPFLPLLLDNLVDDLVGPDIGAGWRAHYLRSPSLTLLRRSHGGPRGVATAGDVRTRAPAHRLRQPLLALAALALLAAWLLPALDERVASIIAGVRLYANYVPGPVYWLYAGLAAVFLLAGLLCLRKANAPAPPPA